MNAILCRIKAAWLILSGRAASWQIIYVSDWVHDYSLVESFDHSAFLQSLQWQDRHAGVETIEMIGVCS